MEANGWEIMVTIEFCVSVFGSLRDQWRELSQHFQYVSGDFVFNLPKQFLVLACGNIGASV